MMATVTPLTSDGQLWRRRVRVLIRARLANLGANDASPDLVVERLMFNGWQPASRTDGWQEWMVLRDYRPASR
jgi:hypothetical protein